ncbi:MAG: histidine kinase [Solirubrobacterales bacterium]
MTDSPQKPAPADEHSVTDESEISVRARTAITAVDEPPVVDTDDAGQEVVRSHRINRSTLLAQAIATNALAVTGLIFFAVLVLDVNAGIGERRTELIILMIAIASVLSLNIALLRRQFAPLEQLVSTMERIDLSSPGDRAEIPTGATEDIAELVDSFNAMIERLEIERREKISASVEAQETERARVARDLHDEANQALTAVILRLEAASQTAPPELASEIDEAKALAGQAMEELLDVVRRLRPTTLDLGLRNALSAQISDFGDRTGIESHFVFDGDSRKRLGDDRELAVYRVVQEALSNIVQHADASRVDVRLTVGDSIILKVVDDGVGFDPAAPSKRFGVTGMRERALLVDGSLDIDSMPGEGTELTMELI